MSLHMTSSQIKFERNKEEKIIYAIDHDENEEEIVVTLNETVYDLKRKIEKKFHLHTDILKDKKIRKKGAKDRTFKDLGDNDTSLAFNHIHNDSRIYFSTLKNNGGKLKIVKN